MLNISETVQDRDIVTMEYFDGTYECISKIFNDTERRRHLSFLFQTSCAFDASTSEFHFEDMFTHFDTIHERDRRTDGRMDTAPWHKLRYAWRHAAKTKATESLGKSFNLAFCSI